MHPILENAAQSIRIGTEDCQSTDPYRVLSAVRNITAGVLLLFKEKLRQLSPPDSDDVLLKERIRVRKGRNDELRIVGEGNKTVNVEQIRQRLADLGVAVDWKSVEAIVKARNEVEHHSTALPSSRLKELIYDTFTVISRFITGELKVEPAVLLGQEVWGILLSQAKVYEAQMEECGALLEGVSWPSKVHERISTELRCSKCSSELLVPRNPSEENPLLLEFTCRACGNSMEYCDIVESAVSESFAGEEYIAMTDGGDPPVEDCFECGKSTFIMELGECVACGVEPHYDTCVRCGASLGIQEQVLEGLCGYCSYVTQKDD